MPPISIRPPPPPQILQQIRPANDKPRAPLKSLTVSCSASPQPPPLWALGEPGFYFLPVRDKHTTHRDFAYAVAFTKKANSHSFASFYYPTQPPRPSGLPLSSCTLPSGCLPLSSHLPGEGEYPQSDVLVLKSISPIKQMVQMRRRPRVGILPIVPGRGLGYGSLLCFGSSIP